MLKPGTVEDFRTAVRRNNEPRVGALIRAHPEILQITEPRSPGSSWLHVAAAGRSLSVAKLLLAAGMPVDAHDRNRATPLSRATDSRGNIELVQLLLDWGAHPDGPDGPGLGHRPGDVRDIVASQPRRLQQGPLLIAAINNDVEVLKALIAAGADVLAVSFYPPHMTALDFAKDRGCSTAEEFLEPIMQAERAYRAVTEISKSASVDGMRPI